MQKNTLMLIGGAVALALTAGTATADTAAGEAVFKKCRVCHSVEQGKKKVGPSLYGVVGRTPGTLDGYKYSDSMKAFGAGGASWDAATLSTYLINPRATVTKTKMMFPGLKNEADRTAVIAYLDSLDD
jgi:cytochrome c